MQQIRRFVVRLTLLLFLLSSNIEATSLAIFTYVYDGMETWDPSSIDAGISGSEEAVIYMSEELAKLGYAVTVFGNPPANSPYRNPQANPRYIHVHEDTGQYFDIAVSWRAPWNGLQIRNRAGKTYLWPHDTYHWRLSKEQILAFNDVFWLSSWQRSQWMSVNPEFEVYTNIYGNGINVEQFSPCQERENPYSCIYGSNYARGLELLLDVWPAVKIAYPRAQLDIYYGWEHWGLLTASKEAALRDKIARYGSIGVKEHGKVGHQELNEAFAKASFWTYPCIYDETFCITGLRAQYAGAIPVIITSAALNETVRHGYICNSPAQYLQYLFLAMSQAHLFPAERRSTMRYFINEEYTWAKIAKKWSDTFWR